MQTLGRHLIQLVDFPIIVYVLLIEVPPLGFSMQGIPPVLLDGFAWGRKSQTIRSLLKLTGYIGIPLLFPPDQRRPREMQEDPSFCQEEEWESLLYGCEEEPQAIAAPCQQIIGFIFCGSLICKPCDLRKYPFGFAVRFAKIWTRFSDEPPQWRSPVEAGGAHVVHSSNVPGLFIRTGTGSMCRSQHQ